MSTIAHLPGHPDPVAATRYAVLVNAIVAGGLVVSAGAAAILYASPDLYRLLFDEMGPTLGGWVAMAMPLAIVLAFAGRVRRLGPLTSWIVFLAFAAATGIAVACVFGSFTAANVDIAFLTCALGFLCLALIGFRARCDLSPTAKFLVVSLSGLTAAILAILYMRFGLFDLILASAGIVIFAALAAADTDRVRRIYGTAGGSPEKRAITGALTLYFDLIDLPMSAFRPDRDSRAVRP